MARKAARSKSATRSPCSRKGPIGLRAGARLAWAMTTFASRWAISWFALTATLALHLIEEATSSAYLGRGQALEALRLLLPWLPPFQPLVWLINVG